jgi:hypothetical protein
MPAPQNSLEALVAAPVEVTVGGVALQITPLTMAQLPRVLQLAQPFLLLLETVRGPEDAMALLADHGDAVTQITAIAADVPLAQLQRVSLDYVAELFVAVLEVNADFFAARMPAVVERLQAGLGRVAALAPTASAGPMPSAG